MTEKPLHHVDESTAPKGLPPWDIPATWAWTTVERAGSVRLLRQKSPKTESAAYPTKYLRAANITPNGLDLAEVLEMDFDPVERQVYSLQTGDVVLAAASGSSAQVGRAALWLGEIPGCCFQNHVIRFRPHAVVPGFALLAFQQLAEAGHFASVARGVGIQNLGVLDFVRLPFPVPPLQEQDRIVLEASLQLARGADARESIESALRLNTQQDNTILEGAVLGGLVQSTTESATSVALSKKPRAQSSLFEDRKSARPMSSDFADVVERALPSGWRWVRVDEAGEVRLGRQRSPDREYGDHPFPYLRVANVFEDRIDTSDVRSMNFTPKEQEIYRLRSGDLLLNEGQSPELVGRPAMYKGEPKAVCFQNTLIRFRSADFVNPQFALLVFRHYLRAGHFKRAARWSTNIAHLGVARFASMPFPLPELKEQKRIIAEATARLEASKSQRRSLESSLDRLQGMRREILHSAVSGSLVPQVVTDEPASALLARLGPPPERKVPAAERTERMTRRARERDARVRALYETMRTLRGSIPPERLFEAAGYDRDSTGDVEAFYLALRAELGVRIRQFASDGGIRLEVITDAP
jgi:type I restriction enzyme S subunit